MRIEIVSEVGHEMQIKVTGAYTDIAPLFDYAQTTTTSSISCEGKITDLNAHTLTSMRLELSDKVDLSNIIKSVSVTPDKYGNFKADFTELASDTNYYINVVFGTKDGEYTALRTCRTDREVIVDTTSYDIKFYRNPEESRKAYTLNVKVGEPIVTEFPVTKYGYVFAGWYTDMEYTEYFELANGKDDYETLYLYARWLKPEEAVKLAVVGASLLNSRSDPTGYAKKGECFREPAILPVAGKTFGGWYADEGLTTPFDFEAPAEGEEVKIYAKWVSDEESSAASTTESTTESAAESTSQTTEASSDTNEISSTEATAESTSTSDTVPAKTNTGVIIGVAVVVLIAAAGVCVFLIRKRK